MANVILGWRLGLEGSLILGWGLGFGVFGLGFRVQRFWVEVEGFVIPGLGLRVYHPELCRIPTIIPSAAEVFINPDPRCL